MKTLSIQFVLCILLSQMLYAMPLIQDTSKYDLFEKSITVEKDTTKHKTIVTVTIGDDDEDDDNSFSNSLRVGMLDFGISSYLAENGGLDLPDELDVLDQYYGDLSMLVSTL